MSVPEEELLAQNYMYLNRALAHAARTLVCSVAATAFFWPLPGAAQPVGTPVAGDSSRGATQAAASTQGLGLRLGYQSDYSKASLVYETPRLWGHQFQNWGRLDLDVELGVSYWRTNEGKSQSMGQLSAIPMLRWWPNESFYLELGSGPTVLSRSEFAGLEFSTRFQFGSHVGMGLLIDKAHRVGIRYSHYSNADIKKPNPGLDVVELAYTYRF